MPSITFVNDNAHVEVQPRETILEASLRNGIPHVHACGGRAKCSTCKVNVLAGLQYCSPPNEPEQRLTARLGLPDFVRLSCQTRVRGHVVLQRLLVEQPPGSPSQPAGTIGSIGEERRLAILFADIADYTAFTERFSPFDVMQMLQLYFSRANGVVARYRGSVSDYFGDGLMAFFGLKDPAEAAADAVKAGFALLEAVREVNHHLQALYGKGIRIRIGIDYGPVVVGKLGLNEGEKLVVIGDHVNTASRIESVNKQYGTQFLVSENVVHQLPGQLLTGRHFNAILKGKSHPVQLFEAVALHPPEVTPPPSATQLSALST
jgi:adenylate cyclase